MATPLSSAFAYLHRGPHPEPVPVAEVAATAAVLPGELVIPPATYVVHGQAYDCRREGLYRFFSPGTGNAQRVVYVSDTHALLSGLCWLHTHGGRDNFRSDAELLALALTQKLVMTCGPFSTLMTRLLPRFGVRVRVVAVKTLLEPNGYNDGHVLTEVNLDGRWVVFDPDPHVFYRHGGTRLGLLDLVPQVQAGDFEREPLARTVPFAITEFRDPKSTYDYGLWYETACALGDDAFRRVMMIPVIPDGGANWYTAFSRADHARAEELWRDQGLKYLPPRELRSRFYA
jgi:hypothetical protein